MSEQNQDQGMNSVAANNAWDEMRKSPMNRWVGHGDPQAIGQQNLRAAMALWRRRRPELELAGTVFRRVQLLAGSIPQDLRLLDYGCGIGRTTLAMALAYPAGEVVGVDIVPSMIGFCRRTVVPVAANATFGCLMEDHPLYYRLARGHWEEPDLQLEVPKAWSSANAGTFDAAIAFSVLTHSPSDMAYEILQTLGTVLKPGGLLVASCFLATPRDPRWLAATVADKLDHWHDYEPGEPLGYVAWDLGHLAWTAHEGGLRLISTEFGSRDGGPGLHPHDLLLLEKM